MNLLLIDDNQEYLDSMQEILETSGHRCDKSKFLEDVAALLKRGRHDAAVASLRNKGVPSLKIMDDLSYIDPDMKLILVTDEFDYKIARRAIDKGAYSFFVKPIDFNLLSEIINEIND